MNFNGSLRRSFLLNSKEKSEVFRCLAVQTFKDANLRSEMAMDRDTWPTILRQLRDIPREPTSGESAMLKLLQLCSNLSAATFAGPTDLLLDVCNELLQLKYAEPNLQRVKWQVLSNFAVEFQHFNRKDLHSLISQLKAVDIKILLGSPSTAFPFLTFISLLSDSTDASEDDLRDLFIECAVLEEILKCYPEWIQGELEYDRLVYSGANLVSILVKHGNFKFLQESVRHDLSQKVTLFKILDSILASPNLSSQIVTGPFWESHSGIDFRNALVAECKQAAINAVPYIARNTRKEPEALLLWNLNCSLLEIMGSILAYISEVELAIIRSNLLHYLISLLKVTESLPKASKLKKMTPGYQPDVTDFPNLKSLLIPVITYLVKGDTIAQNEMRDSGGLISILNCCIIDSNNPFMKERALLCIKYLLLNNADNQKIVAEMEARHEVDPDVLQKAGFEAGFCSGQLKIKSDRPEAAEN